MLCNISITTCLLFLFSLGTLIIIRTPTKELGTVRCSTEEGASEMETGNCMSLKNEKCHCGGG